MIVVPAAESPGGPTRVSPVSNSNNSYIQRMRGNYSSYWELYLKMGMGKKMTEAEFYKALEDARADGKITQEELADIFGVNITKAAREDFTNGRKSFTLTELKAMMEDYVDYYEVTGISFVIYASGDRFVRPYSGSLDQWWFGFWGRMSNEEKKQFVHDNFPFLRPILERVFGYRKYDDSPQPDETEEEKSNKREDAESEMLNDLDALTSQSANQGHLRKFLFGLYYSFYECAVANGWPLPSAIGTDPLVARYFLKNVLEPFVAGGGVGVNKEKLEEVKTFAERVAELRESVGDAALDGVDPTLDPKKFEHILELNDENSTKNRDEILRELWELRRLNSRIKAPELPQAYLYLSPQVFRA